MWYQQLKHHFKNIIDLILRYYNTSDLKKWFFIAPKLTKYVESTDSRLFIVSYLQGFDFRRFLLIRFKWWWSVQYKRNFHSCSVNFISINAFWFQKLTWQISGGCTRCLQNIFTLSIIFECHEFKKTYQELDGKLYWRCMTANHYWPKFTVNNLQLL